MSRCLFLYEQEVLEDQDGTHWVAPFPEEVNNPTQYGNGIKAHCVYMSQFQLIPLRRVADYCRDQLGIPLSKGSISNFNQAAYEKLEGFEVWVRKTLLDSPLNNADETGVNMNGKGFWFQGEKECPENIKTVKKRGPPKQSKSRNLLNRLRNFEDDTLRFMENPIVPFTNNRAENDLRMTKVQQKISGCFRSLKGARIFCRVRSYLLTCQKNGVNPAEALRLLFEGKLPDFIS